MLKRSFFIGTRKRLQAVLATADEKSCRVRLSGIKRADYMAEVYSGKVRRVNCTLMPEQYAQLALAAQCSGRAPAQYLRDAAFAYLEGRYLVPLDMEERLAELSVLLRGIGNNLNQIARRANAVGKTTVFDLLKARREMQRLESTLENFVRHPPRRDS